MKYLTSSLLIAVGILTITLTATSCSNRSDDASSVPIEASIPGVILWTNNCMKCHNLRPPTEFNDAQWGVISSHMRVRANLTGEETRLIREFIQSSN